MNRNTGKKAGILIVFLLVLCMFLLCSCVQEKSTDNSIHIRLTEQITKDNTAIQIPEFYSENEKINRNLKDLEKKSNYLRKIVEKGEKNGSHMEMLSYVNKVKGYPQVTVIWYVDDESAREYNLMTLGADEKNGTPITSKEALEMTGMSGVDLSLHVGKLEQESDIRGELKSTEMQGFQIDENGNIKEIYMKLVLEVTEGEEVIEEEHFFSFVPEEDVLVKLSDRGFDIP